MNQGFDKNRYLRADGEYPSLGSNDSVLSAVHKMIKFIDDAVLVQRFFVRDEAKVFPYQADKLNMNRLYAPKLTIKENP